MLVHGGAVASLAGLLQCPDRRVVMVCLEGIDNILKVCVWQQICALITP